MQDIRRASIRELAFKLKGPTPPRFSFFLGAGASRQSGIPIASEMIRQFREQIILQSCPVELKTEDQKNDWLAGQEWCKADGGDYGKYFERYEPKEFGRQRHIEEMIRDREPSFGYVVLANLMARGYVNTIVTTNFDDLAYKACTTFTGIRPVVYAYGLLAAEMRFTVQRTKILKLHGDYLYSPLKNTYHELAEQDPNMARQVRQVLNEYGLIVVGYGGGDMSVMKVLSDFPQANDLYWCVRRGEEPNTAVKKLLLDKGGFLVEIEGFDEMMNEISHIVGLNIDDQANKDYNLVESTKSGKAKDTVFISYSRKDGKWLEMLKTHLKPFERQGMIKRWDDTEIKPGQIWKDEIKKAIQAAKVVVLLVTPEFLASDFISNDELPPLLANAENEGATVLSVIIKPCSFQQAENISKYQAINPPNKALTQMRLADRHRMLSELAERILGLVEKA